MMTRRPTFWLALLLTLVASVATSASADQAAPSIRLLDPPETRKQGATEPLRFEVENADGPGYDVLAISWHDEGRKLIDAFAHEIEPKAGVIEASKLDLLPTGTHYVQVLLRKDVRTVDKAFVQLRVTGSGAAPKAEAFVVDFPKLGTYDRKTGGDLALVSQGSLPSGHDVLAIAWSLDEERMVNEFVTRLTGSDLVIPAVQMRKLPEGRNSVQLLVRNSRSQSDLAGDKGDRRGGGRRRNPAGGGNPRTREEAREANAGRNHQADRTDRGDASGSSGRSGPSGGAERQLRPWRGVGGDAGRRGRPAAAGAGVRCPTTGSWWCSRGRTVRIGW